MMDHIDATEYDNFFFRAEPIAANGYQGHAWSLKYWLS